MKESGRNEMLWGFAVLAVTGGITAGVYFAAAPAITYWIAWPGVAWGAYLVARGWAKASARWRLLGLLAVAAAALAAVLALLNPYDLSPSYDLVEVGDCLDQDSRAIDCDGTAAYRVESIKRYPDDLPFPGQATFAADAEVCTKTSGVYFVHPTRETWDDGDRSLLCVEDLLPNPDG